MRLYLVRHGQTDHNIRNMFYGWTDPDINSAGIEQARRLADFFENIAYDAIYSSDLLRAAHTAKIILGDKKLPLVQMKGLREMYYGDWEDKPYQYIKAEYDNELRLWREDWKNAQMPSGESFRDFYGRVTEALDEVISQNKGRTVIIVAHNGAISAMLCRLTGAGQDGFWRFFSEQGCYSSALVSGKRITIEKINCPVNIKK